MRIITNVGATMGSEIVFVFTPICLAALVYLGYLTSRPTARIAAILCILLSSFFSATTVSVVKSYSFWTQAGFFSFAFLLAAIVALPVLLALLGMAARPGAGE